MVRAPIIKDEKAINVLSCPSLGVGAFHAAAAIKSVKSALIKLPAPVQCFLDGRLQFLSAFSSIAIAIKKRVTTTTHIIQATSTEGHRYYNRNKEQTPCLPSATQPVVHCCRYCKAWTIK
jgi:hypothetical protein